MPMSGKRQIPISPRADLVQPSLGGVAPAYRLPLIAVKRAQVGERPGIEHSSQLGRDGGNPDRADSFELELRFSARAARSSTSPAASPAMAFASVSTACGSGCIGKDSPCR